MGNQSASVPSTPAGAPVKAISVADELAAGKALAQVREQTAAAIVKNRDLLRLLVDRGYATDEQRAALEELYPTPKRKVSTEAVETPPAE